MLLFNAGKHLQASEHAMRLLGKSSHTIAKVKSRLAQARQAENAWPQAHSDAPEATSWQSG
jgi:hypothetical protein